MDPLPFNFFLPPKKKFRFGFKIYNKNLSSFCFKQKSQALDWLTSLATEKYVFLAFF